MEKEKLLLSTSPSTSFSTPVPQKKTLIELQTVAKPLITYRIYRNAKSNRQKYTISEMNGQELMSVTGGWRYLVKALINSQKLLKIVFILLGILILESIFPDKSMYINFRKNLSEILFDAFFTLVVVPIVLIPIVIIAVGVFLLIDASIYKIQSSDGLSLGEIRGSIPLFGRINWKVKGQIDENQAYVQTPGFKVLDISSSAVFRIGKIRTSSGLFKAKIPVRSIPIEGNRGYHFSTKCEITDINDNPCLKISWINHELHKTVGGEYRIDSYGIMSRFLTFTVSICIIEKFLSSYEDYNDFQ